LTSLPTTVSLLLHAWVRAEKAQAVSASISLRHGSFPPGTNIGRPHPGRTSEDEEPDQKGKKKKKKNHTGSRNGERKWRKKRQVIIPEDSGRKFTNLTT